MTSDTTDNYQLKFNPIATSVLVTVHAMSLLAFFPFAFSWSAVAVMFFLYWVTASLGICLGFHRYLTHRGFSLPKWLAYTVVFFWNSGLSKWPHQMGWTTSYASRWLGHPRRPA